MATKAEVGRALAATMPLFANFRAPASAADMDVLVSAWLGMVGHLDAATFQAALQLVATRSEFFPTPVLVLAAVTELTAAPARTGDEAWGDVKAAIAQHGVYHPPDGAQYGDFRNYFWEFPDPLVGELVKDYGWTYLCQSEDEMADRAHFRKAYEMKQQRAREQARLTPDLLAFQEQHRPALPPPTRQREAARLLAAVATGLGRDGAKGERG